MIDSFVAVRPYPACSVKVYGEGCPAFGSSMFPLLCRGLPGDPCHRSYRANAAILGCRQHSRYPRTRGGDEDPAGSSEHLELSITSSAVDGDPTPVSDRFRQSLHSPYSPLALDPRDIDPMEQIWFGITSYLSIIIAIEQH